MTVSRPNFSRSINIEAYSFGLDYTLIRILSPKKDRGIATLMRQQQIWNYLPKINRTIRIPPAMMMSSWMGSDFNEWKYLSLNLFFFEGLFVFYLVDLAQVNMKMRP